MLVVPPRLASGSVSLGLASGTDTAIGGTVSSLLSSGLLGQNATVNATAGNGTNVTSVSNLRRWRRAGRRYWRGRRALLEDGSEAPTTQPTVALADDEALSAVMDTIGSLSSAQLSDAVSGEAAATVATHNVMMASGRAFAGSDADPASPPANGGGSAPRVSLGATAAVAYLNGTEVGADVNVDTQLQQWGYNVYAGADKDGAETKSALVSLAVSTDEPDGNGGRRRRRLKVTSRRRLNGEDDEEGDEAPLTFVMQNIKPIDYSVGAEEVRDGGRAAARVCGMVIEAGEAPMTPT